MGSGVQRRVEGKFIGTGSDMNIDTVGFKPRRVEIINVDGQVQAVWMQGMADDSMGKTTSAFAIVSSNGITPRDNGFTMGADSDLNVADEAGVWAAWE